MFKTLIKIELIKNSKLPATKWSDKKNHKKNINISANNTGILTGDINDLLIIDIDLKNNGVAEMQKYFDDHSEPQTVKQTSPNNGYHLFFKQISNNKDDNYLIQNYLKTTTNIRPGIDIRSNGAYIVSSPSSINNKCYKYIRNFDDFPVLEIPSTLITFLLNNFKASSQAIKPTAILTQPITSYKNNYEYKITDDKLKNLLELLPIRYLDNYNEWLKITTSLKSLNKHEIWEKWSRKSTNYNHENNNNIWNNNAGLIDVNYIIHILNNEGHKLKTIIKYIPYIALKTDITCEMKTINTKYTYDKNNFSKEQFIYDDFNDNETIIIKSCTGTGKTTATTQHIAKYITNTKYKVLSIVNLITLAGQHEESFNKANLELSDYHDKNFDINNVSSVICINSLYKYYNTLSDDEIKNYIILIDEGTSFINAITHNNTICNLKEIYYLLKKMINKCHKLVILDANITDNIFNLLENRNDTNRIFISNQYQKFDGIQANRVRDENKIINMMKVRAKENNYFLCASDSCKNITKLYHDFTKDITNVKELGKYILITSDSKLKIVNASKQFKNKFVFYSPSITFGVDYSSETAQDVFIFIKGNSIDPLGMFQQATRTRNIKELYYYSEAIGKEPTYKNIEDVEKYYMNINNTGNTSITNISTCLNNDDTMTILKNSFFKLFCYQEYMMDTFRTNKTIHFEDILYNAGFIINNNEGECDIKISKAANKAMTSVVENIQYELFKEYVDSSENTRRDAKFDALNVNIDAVGLTNAEPEILLNYQDILTDKYKLGEYFNIIRCIKDDEYINLKLEEHKEKGFDIKTYNNIYNKILIIRQLERDNKINMLTIGIDKKELVVINNYDVIKKVFRSEKDKPNNWVELQKLIISLWRNIMGNDIITSKQRTINKTKVMEYKFNYDKLRNFIKLDAYKNMYYKNYDVGILQMLCIEKPSKPENLLIGNLDIGIDDIFIN